MAQPITTTWLCEDCTFTVIYATPGPEALDDSHFTDPRKDATHGLMPESHSCIEWHEDVTPDDLTCDGECERHGFSSTPCGRCGTDLAGYRQAFTIWQREPALP